MKNFVALVLLCAAVFLIIPVTLLKNSVDLTYNQTTTQAATQAPSQPQNTITVFRSSEQKKAEIDLFEYVCGSVAAEMPLSYHEEALKAQAVACYTNALRLKTNSANTEGYHITDDSSVHQGYLSEEERKQKWGDDFTKYEAKLKNIVEQVEGLALYYEGELCIAAFHAICGGKTEAAQSLWDEKIPYLVSVQSMGDSLSPQYSSTVVVDAADFKKCAEKLGVTEKSASLKNIIKITKATKSGTVIKAMVNKKELPGDEIRKAFGLRSAVFTVECTKSSVTFNVLGYGHGVGMSQYGADFMARQGSSYQEI